MTNYRLTQHRLIDVLDDAMAQCKSPEEGDCIVRLAFEMATQARAFMDYQREKLMGEWDNE